MMRRILLTAFLIFTVTATYGYAQMHEGMMGGQGQQPAAQGQMSGPGMMGYGGYGMGQGMMGYGMNPGTGYGGCDMHGPGMGYGMNRGMMGYGGYGMGHHQMMHGGSGMMGYGASGENTEQYKKFMDETLDLRKKMHDKKFEYFEALRNPQTTQGDLMKMQKEMGEIQSEIYEKWQK
jgi:hypothetical protein